MCIRDRNRIGVPIFGHPGGLEGRGFLDQPEKTGGEQRQRGAQFLKAFRAGGFHHPGVFFRQGVPPGRGCFGQIGFVAVKKLLRPRAELDAYKRQEYVYGTLPELFQMLDAGEIDLIGRIQSDSELRKQYVYTCLLYTSACDSKNTKISHVLQAIGLEEEYAVGTIRISLGRLNATAEVTEIADAIISIIK